MNGFLVAAQQALAVVHAKAAALWTVLSAIAANKPLPARDVIVYTAVFAVLLTVVVPRLPKLLAKKGK